MFGKPFVNYLIDSSRNPKTDNNIIYCPLTLQKENIQKINFYTFPVEIFSEKEIDKELNNFLVKYFTNLKKENNISNILFKIRKKNDRSIAENDTINLNKTISEIFINLNLSNLEIKKNFKQSLRTILNKKYDFLEYIVIDKKNYQKNEILKMRDLHIKVSGRETRTKDAWCQNEKMILDGNGFIIKAIYQNKTISYSLFYFNNITCVYFASCSLSPGRFLRASIPPWIIGLRVLTRPSRISGKLVRSETCWTAIPAACMNSWVPPVLTRLNPALLTTCAKSITLVLL